MGQNIFANILIGCGGSGLKTLARVSDLMSEDPSWRHRMAKEVFFFAVDTNINDLDRFSDSVANAFPTRGSSPHVERLHLSSRVSTLKPLVVQRMIEPFANGADTRGQQRLLEHWWSRNDQSLFNASSIPRSLTLGAGQCPPVSFFLTWYNEQKLEQAIQNIITQIINRTGGLEQIQGINVVLTTSLAGGTGRGSWNLIAFKFREAFRKRNAKNVPRPTAFLYDCSVFPNVFNEQRRQEVPMRLNSLTGLSELSCWIKNRRNHGAGKGDTYIYRLPSMDNPANEESDVVIADLRLNDNEAAPVDHVYLCFGENTNHALGNSNRYYEMFGSAIYGTLAAASIFDETTINGTCDFNSLGTITYEVSAASMRKYFESRVREKFAERAKNVDSEKAKQIANSIWSSMALAAQSNASRKNFNASLLDEISKQLQDNQQIKPRHANIRETAESTQDLDSVEAAIKSVTNPSNAQTIASQIVDSLLGELRQKFQQAIYDEVTRQFKSEQSIGTVVAVLDDLSARVRLAADSFGSQFREVEDPIEVAQALSGRRWYGLMKPFEDSEITTIEESVTNFLTWAYKDHLEAEIKRLFQALESSVEHFRLNSRAMLEVAIDLEKDFENRVKEMSRRTDVPASSEEVFDELFADPTSPEEAIPDEFSAVRFFKREIKPIYDRETERDDLAQEMKNVDLLPLFQEFFARNGSETQRQLQQIIEPKFQKLIEGISIGGRFVEERFSLLNCLPTIFDAWCERIETEPSEDERVRLIAKFSSFFGFSPEINGDKVRMRPLDSAIVHMGINLAKTCKPYWILKSPTGNPGANVFFNVKGDAGDALDEFEKLRGSNIGWSAKLGDKAKGIDLNPFLIFAVSFEGVDRLDDLQSVEYFRDPNVSDEIKKAESPEGLLTFDTSSGRNGGLGFVDPIYVNEEQLVAMRWRPWADGDFEVKIQNEFDVTSALYYCLLGNHLKDADEEGLLQKFADHQWPLPLVSAENRGKFVCSRSFRHVKDQGFEEDFTSVPGWEISSSIATHMGVKNLSQTLMENEPLRQRILEERDSFWSSVIAKVDLVKGGPALKNLMLQHTRWIQQQAAAESSNDENRRVWENLLDFAAKELG